MDALPWPLSRIQLLWTRFWPPPAPAKASAGRTRASDRPAGMRPKWVTASGRAAQASAVMAVAMATTMKNWMMPILKNSIRSTMV